MSVKKETIVKILKILAKSQGTTMLGDFAKDKLSPFQMLIGTILSARCRDEVTDPVSRKLFKKYPTAKKLANAKYKDVEQAIKSIGFFRNKAQNIITTSKMIIDDFNGKVPNNFEDLMKFPGVGRKVAGCVMVYAFQKDAIPVDTHVHRISNRLGWVQTIQPEKTELELMKVVPKKYWQIVNDFLVHHGKTICKPITPLCSQCSVNKLCKKVEVTRSK